MFLYRGNGVGDFNGSSSRDKNRVIGVSSASDKSRVLRLEKSTIKRLSARVYYRDLDVKLTDYKRCNENRKRTANGINFVIIHG